MPRISPLSGLPRTPGLTWQEAETAGGDELRVIPSWELALLLSESLQAVAERGRLLESGALVGKRAKDRGLHDLGRAIEVADRLHYYLGAALGTEGVVVGAEPLR